MGVGSGSFSKDAKRGKVLESNTLEGLAKYMNSTECINIVLMLGAGVSTSAGIPDFRSPKTGLYSNLARLNLPHPEAVFEINFFRSNPVPFYTLAHELYPGKFRPTISHSFIRLLANRSLLLKCFTQNIDTLERLAGVPGDKIIEAHGSFASQSCIKCQSPFDDEKMKSHILEKRIARCERCKGLVKPDIVFFGESLPPEFIRSIPQVMEADLLIVMGTSLTVHPFASLASMPDATCPRVLINLERVGDIGKRPNDLVLLGKCDEVVSSLCKKLGWEEELLELWKETESIVEDKEKKADDKAKQGVEAEVEALTSAVEKGLALSEADNAKVSLKTDISGKAQEIPEKVIQGDKLRMPEKTNTIESESKTTPATKEALERVSTNKPINEDESPTVRVDKTKQAERTTSGKK